jgi:hypothetical protein
MPTAERSGSEETYRPISGQAIASFVLALIFGIMVVAGGVAGLVAGLPLILSNWTLLLPVGGVVLAVLAQRQIRSSEGTRAGQRLAVWGLWLSVLFGLGYGAYSVGTYFAIRHQVERFLFDEETGFFARLKRRDGLEPVGVDEAFLLTRPADERGPVGGAEKERAEFRFRQVIGRFRDSPFVRAISQGGADTTVTAQGISGLKYEQGGFALDVTVQIATPELSVPFVVTVRSKDTEGAAANKWFIDVSRIFQAGDEVKTERGKALDALRLRSHQFVIRWLKKLRDRDVNDARKDIRNPADFSVSKSNISEDTGKLIDKVLDPDARPGDLDFDATLSCCIPDERRNSPGPPPAPAYWSLSKDGKHLQIAHELALAFDDSKKEGKIGCTGKVILERAGEPFAADPNSKWTIVGLSFSSERASGPTPPERTRR